MQHWMDDPDVRFVCQPSSPLRFTDAPAPALKPSPLLKQHEEEVLGGDFGFWRKNGQLSVNRGDQYGGASEGVESYAKVNCH